MTSFLERDTASDLDLIADVRAGRTEAVAELYERHHAAAIRFARGLTDPATADDVVAEAFVRVWDALRGGNGPTVAFRPYLLTAVRHCFVSHVRRDARHVWVDEHGGPLDVATDAQHDLRDESTILASAFSTLPERWQAVLWHTAVEGEDHDAVGRRLGLRPNAVAALSFRARDGLRKAYLAAHLGAADDECRPYREHLATHVRGKLRTRQREALERHLDGCRSCTAGYLELVALNSHLGAVLAPAVLGAGAATYAAGAASGTALVGSGVWGLVRRVPRPAAAAATAVAVAVVGAGAFAAVSAIDGPDPAGDPAAALAPVPGSPGEPDARGTDPALGAAPADEPADAGRELAIPTRDPAPSPGASPSLDTPAATGGAPAGGTVGSQQSSSPTASHPTAQPSSQPTPTTIASATPGSATEAPPVTPTPTEPSPDPDVTHEDLALGAASHTYYGPHHHLQMSVSSTAASTVLLVDVLGLISYDVHAEPAYLPATCAPTEADAERTVLTCDLGEGEGTFAIDVVVSGALDASVRITAPGNADPDPDDDELRFTD
jgi:RNA polymerase sigma factor (sigma-70 family)